MFKVHKILPYMYILLEPLIYIKTTLIISESYIRPCSEKYRKKSREIVINNWVTCVAPTIMMQINVVHINIFQFRSSSGVCMQMFELVIKNFMKRIRFVSVALAAPFGWYCFPLLMVYPPLYNLIYIRWFRLNKLVCLHIRIKPLIEKYNF